WWLSMNRGPARGVSPPGKGRTETTMRRVLFMGCAVLASGCVVREYREPPPPPVVYREPPPPPPPPAPVVQPEVDVVSVEIQPPVDQPPAVAIQWAPPPMRWDPPPPQPYVEAVWVGGHWTWWNGEWVWARGYWARPPSPAYVYCEPYYEHRGELVVFVPGFWRPTVRVFVPPPATVYVPVAEVRVVHVGYARPVGPYGVFVPPPPGSQPGIIVPAPIGTAPAVVLSAPPVVRPGMVVRPGPNRMIVEVVAPSGVTREGRPVTAQAPVMARDAAAVHPVVVAPPPPVRAAPVARDERGALGQGPGRPAPAPPEPLGPDGGGVGVRRPLPPGGIPAPAPQGAPAAPQAGAAAPQGVSPMTSAGQPVVRPELKPDFDREKGPRPTPEVTYRGGEPVLRPVPQSRPDVAPAQPPGQAQAAHPPSSHGGNRDAGGPRARPNPPGRVKQAERKERNEDR